MLTKTSISVDGNTLERAKELGLNISLITREALNQAVIAAEKAVVNEKLKAAYIADAQVHKEISDEFRHADQTR